MQEKKIDIAIIGVQRSATTSLKHYLRQHPSVNTHIQPECAFFVRDEEYNEGISGLYNKYFNNADREKKWLIKNVDILFFEESIQRLKDHNPFIHLIITLRNPVDRAYSAYWFARRRGWEKRNSFEESLHTQPKIKDRLHLSNISYLDKGVYVNQLEVLFKYFSPDQVKVVLQEDLKQNAAGVISELSGFCNLEADFVPVTETVKNSSAMSKSELALRIVKSRRVAKVFGSLLNEEWKQKLKSTFHNLNEKPFEVPQMEERTRHDLVNYYNLYNKKLEKLLGRDLSGWNK